MGSQDFPLPSSASNKIELTSDDDFQWIVRSSRQSTLLFDSLLSEIHFRLKYSWHVPSEMTAAAVMTSQRRIDRDPHSHQPFPPNFQSSLRWEGQEKQLLKISAAEHHHLFCLFYFDNFSNKNVDSWIWITRLLRLANEHISAIVVNYGSSIRLLQSYY